VISFVAVLVYVVVFPSSVLLVLVPAVLVSCPDLCEWCFVVRETDVTWLLGIFAMPEICALYFHEKSVQVCLLLREVDGHLGARFPAALDVRWRSIKADLFAVDAVDTVNIELFSVRMRTSATWLVLMVVVPAGFETELKTDLDWLLSVDEIDWVFPALEDRDELNGENTEIASRIASSPTSSEAVDGNWSSTAAGANDAWLEVESSCVVASNAVRALEFNNSGNVDAVGDKIELEVVLEEFGMMGPCCANAEFKPQSCGVKSKLSLLMMSAA
jgi:hypothetical protein